MLDRKYFEEEILNYVPPNFKHRPTIETLCETLLPSELKAVAALLGEVRIKSQTEGIVTCSMPSTCVSETT